MTPAEKRTVARLREQLTQQRETIKAYKELISLQATMIHKEREVIALMKQDSDKTEEILSKYGITQALLELQRAKPLKIVR